MKERWLSLISRMLFVDVKHHDRKVRSLQKGVKDEMDVPNKP